MASAHSDACGSRTRRGRFLRTLSTIVGILALVGAIGAGVASAEVIPSGGDFQTVPSPWTAAGVSGNLNTVSASQVSSGSNTFYRTQYTTPANVLGGGLLNMAATEGITSPSFTWTQVPPQSIVASFQSGVQYNGLLGVDADAGIGMYLQNQTTGTETLLASQRLTQSSPDFSTVSAPVSPSLLITGDSYRVQVRITFSPTVQVLGSTTVDLDNVFLTETPPAPPAPVFSTAGGSITNVTSTGATAVATIDPGSVATTVQVDYGTSTSYGSSTGTITIPANNGPTPVSIPISGLSPTTGYDAQIVATNSGGVTQSLNLPFTTTPNVGPMPTVSSGTVQGTPGERSATLGATIDDQGLGSTYYVQYGTSANNYPNTTPSQTNPSGLNGPTPVTTDLTGLQPGTTYHAQYVVTSSAGTISDSDFTFTTAAASPPSVSNPTASTTSTDGTQETARATVDPGANDTEVAVSYGPTSSYGSTTSSVLVPGGTGPQTVSIPINGLTPGNTYHYTVTATNIDGSAGTADATFTPSAQPGPPVGQTSVSAGPGETTATLASTIDTGGSSGSYYLQYGTSNGYGSQTALQPLTATSGNQQLTGSLTGLQPGTTYHAQFVAMVNGSATSYGSDFTFTTAAASPPTIDAGPNAGTSDSAGDQETITATVDPGNHDTQVTVSYGTTSSYGTTTAATTIPAGSGATAVSIPISGLTAGTTYHYTLTASNADGNVNSGDATFTPSPSSAPAVGPTSASTGPDQTSVTLSSSVNTGGSGGTYEVQYGTDTTYGSQTPVQNLTTSTSSQTLTTALTNLQPGTTYYARFVVMVHNEPTSYGDDYSFTTNGPPVYVSTPTASSGTTGTQETISVTVNPGGLPTSVTVNYGPDSHYQSGSATVSFTAGNSPQTRQITVSGLVAGNAYHYDVVATNSAGTTTEPDNTFTPTSQSSPPIGATSTTVGPGETSVALGASVDTAGSGGSFYLQYGTSTAYGSQTSTQALSASSASQPLTASLSGLVPATTYHARFVVIANGYPTSDGADFTFTTAPLSPPTFAVGGPSAMTTSADGTQETISASVNPGSHDTTVSVNYGTSSTYGSTATASVIAAGSGSTIVSIPLSGLTPGTTYHYQLVATNADGSIQSDDETFTPMATTQPPVSTTTTQSPGTTTVTLDASVDTGGMGGTYYVEYGTGSGYGSRSAPQPLAATSGDQPLHVVLTGLRAGTTYHIRFVVVVDGHPVSYGHDYTFTTAGRAHTTTAPASCVAAYVTASARTLRTLSIPAGAQVTARHGLRVVIARGVTVSGTPTFQMSGGRRTAIRGRAFTITRSQLRAGRTSTVRVVIPQRHRRSATMTLRIGATSCGIQLTSATAGHSLQLRLRLPLGARRVAFALPRGMSSATAITLTTPLGIRTLALTGTGARLRLRGAAGALRVSARAGSITVTGLPATTVGLRLRFSSNRARGRVTARVTQRSGGAASAQVTVGRRARS